MESDTRSVWCIPILLTVHSDLAKKFQHFGRKGVIEQIDFSEVLKLILQGIGHFADNH